MFFLSIQGSTIRRRKMYEEFLGKVSILGESQFSVKKKLRLSFI